MDDLNLYNMTLSLFDREITQDDLDSTTPSKEVRLCKRYHNIAILRVLREFDWSFLVTRILIDEEDDAGQDYGFIHGYKLPAGLLKVVHAFTDYPYEVRGGRIYTDHYKPPVYGIMEDLPAEGAPLDLYELIALALAFQIAPLLAPEGRIDQIILQKYSWALNGLIAAEARNNSREADRG